MMLKFLQNKILHPFLFAAFPVLFLYAENLSLVSGAQIWVPLGITTLVTAIIFLASSLLYHNYYKAGLFTAAFVGLFFLYRPAFAAVQHKTFLNLITFTRHRDFFFLFLLPLLAWGWYLFKSKNSFTKLNQVLNVTALILLIPSLAKATDAWLQAADIAPAKATHTAVSNATKTNPDIYYFIMDGYGRHDVLEKTFHYNNRPFLNALKQRGFYVAEKSTSNYYQTIQSVSSALNYDYLPNLADYQDWPKKLHGKAKKIIQNSNLRKTLKTLDYKYVCYKTAVDFTDLKDADYYFSHNLDFSEFDLVLLNTTPLPDVFQKLFARDLYTLHRETMLYPFQNLNQAIRIPEPKFVQIHVLAPHPPFVFDALGKPVQPERNFDMKDANHFLEKASRDEYLQGLQGQISFINQQLLQAVDSIRKYSKRPPIIIIQGDHGVRLNSNFDSMEASNHAEAFANLSAFHFPNQDTTGLYPEISPVNIFRVVLNNYFNANLPLLPDRNYYSSWPKVFNFTDVTDRVKPLQKPKNEITAR